MDNLENQELEVAILGCLIGNGDLLHTTHDLLDSECFTTLVNQNLYKSITQLMEETGNVTKVQLYHKFTGIMDDDGNECKQNFLDIASSYSAKVITSFRSHAKTLQDLKQKRNLKELLENSIKSFYNKDAIDIASDVASGCTKIISDTPESNSIGVRAAFEEIYNTVASPEATYKAKTGITRIDAAMGGGMQQGRVYAFLAPAKCGKTMLATTVSNKLCDDGRKHLFVCAEMGSGEITQRMLGQRIDLPTSVFSERKDEELKALIVKQVVKVRDNIIFENEPGIELDRLKMVIERHVHKEKIEGFILDYYQLVAGQENHQSQAQHLENVANWIHRVCKKHNIWCLLLVQANDEGKVLGSRGLDRACDQKYMIERPMDEQGDPKDSNAWLKMKLSRYTQLRNLGSEQTPTLRISENGTHMIEI